MRAIYVLIAATVVFTSCKFNPDELAQDYCNCRAEMEKGKKSGDDCAKLAESHYLRIQDDEEAQKTYTQRILDCVSNSEIKTE